MIDDHYGKAIRRNGSIGWSARPELFWVEFTPATKQWIEDHENTPGVSWHRAGLGTFIEIEIKNEVALVDFSLRFF